MSFLRLPLVWSVLAAGTVAWADQPTLPAATARDVDFLADVRPLLERRCFDCHAGDAREGGLRLDRGPDALVGGDGGAVIVPGKSAESRLIRFIAGLEPDSQMPPDDDPLTADEIGLLRAWIDRGADWPTDADAPADEVTHWAFRPVVRPEPPVVPPGAGPVRNPVDAFVLAGLAEAGVAPSPEADRYTLIRRLSLDLTGLPPTPEEADAFAADPSPDAYERLVDRLLDSPHFGERWGRHWLDKARYADSDGYEKDKPRPDAWRYRDWVIDAINRDLPYDRFTTEQLAGDLLPDATPDQRLATAFHRQTLTNTEGGVDKEQFRVEAVFDRVETTGTVWLGLTVGCARCHTHKYDPIAQREYYRLFAFFDNGDEAEADVPAPGGGTMKARVIAQRTEQPRATQMLRRGDFLQPLDPVTPGTLAVLPPLEPRAQAKGADRLDLAAWLFSESHPLTARVAANQVWEHLFGRGLVRTLNDFGTRGEPPTHPELLDWLADEFRRLGWSRKALIRTIVASATYRRSAAHRSDLATLDPNNDLLARQNRFRVEAELVRDLSLAAAGLLSRKVGGPSVFPPLPPDVAALSYANNFKWKDSTGEDRYRRGMYTFFKRTAPHPNLTTFDCPDANTTCVDRNLSNTPLQALTTLNEVSFVESARGLARRLLGRKGTDADRLADGLRLCLSRPTEPEDVARFAALLDECRAHYRGHPDDAAKLVGDLTAAGVPATENASWVAVARVMLNLDGFLVRE